MNEKGPAAVSDFFRVSIAMARFLKGCSELPAFVEDLPFEQCLVLYILSMEQAPLPIEVLCRHIGMPWQYAVDLVRGMKQEGLVSVSDEGISITKLGRQRLKKAENSVRGAVERGVPHPKRLPDLSKQILIVSRIWAKTSPEAELVKLAQASKPRESLGTEIVAEVSPALEGLSASIAPMAGVPNPPQPPQRPSFTDIARRLHPGRLLFGLNGRRRTRKSDLNEEW